MDMRIRIELQALLGRHERDLTEHEYQPESMPKTPRSSTRCALICGWSRHAFGSDCSTTWPRTGTCRWSQMSGRQASTECARSFFASTNKGKVLEVACGTGSNVVRRNGEILYDVGAIDELHQFEYSKEMLKQ